MKERIKLLKRCQPLHLLIHRFVKIISYSCMNNCPYCKLDFGDSKRKSTILKEKRKLIESIDNIKIACDSKLGISFAAIGDALANKNTINNVCKILDMSIDSIETHISTANDDLDLHKYLLNKYPNLTISRTINPLYSGKGRHNNLGIEFDLDRLYYSVLITEDMDISDIDEKYFNSNSVSFITEDFDNRNYLLSNYINSNNFKSILKNEKLMNKIVRDDYLLYGFQYDCMYNAKLDYNCYKKYLDLTKAKLLELSNYKENQLIDLNECINHCIDMSELTSSKYYFYALSDKFDKYKQDIKYINEFYQQVYSEPSNKLKLNVICSLVPNKLKTHLNSHRSLNITSKRAGLLIKWELGSDSEVNYVNLSEFSQQYSNEKIFVIKERLNEYFDIVIAGLGKDLMKSLSDKNYSALFTNDAKLLNYYKYKMAKI